MKNISKLFPVIYVVFIIAVIGLGINYLNKLPDYAKEFVIGPVTVQKDSIKPPTTDFTELKGTISAPVDVFKLSVPTPDQVEKGKTLFTTNCVTCHGTEGKGDGVGAANLNPKPRNFTSVDGWTNGPKFSQMYKTLQEGITKNGMASYANLPPEDRIALIHYIQETFTKTYPKNTDEELKELDKTYSLSLGLKQPNQIPIKSASGKIVLENEAVTKKVKALSEAVDKNTTDTAAVILRSVTNNMTKVLTVLATDNSWEQNENQLYILIGSNPVSNGFKGRAATLSQREITAIHQYLKNLFAGYKG